MKTICIGKDFSDTPIGRYPSDGPFSGERFREEFLAPALASGEAVTVVIDDVEGFGSSFLDESFGGLVRKRRFSASQLKKQLTVQCEKREFLMYRDLIWKYIGEAAPE